MKEAGGQEGRQERTTHLTFTRKILGTSITLSQTSDNVPTSYLRLQI